MNKITYLGHGTASSRAPDYLTSPETLRFAENVQHAAAVALAKYVPWSISLDNQITAHAHLVAFDALSPAFAERFHNHERVALFVELSRLKAENERLTAALAKAKGE